MPAQPIRVAVVNDYELVVAGLAAMLAPFREQVVLVEADSGLPVVGDVDVVLFDTFARGEGGRGLEGLVASGTARIVVFSWHTDPGVVDRALREGADGYLHKALGAHEIVAALEKVCDGEVVRPDPRLAMTDPDLDRASGAWPGQREGLSPREGEILAYITQGLSNQEIAESTYLSINSVKTYIRTAYRKIGVTRRSQAVAWGMTNGFVPDRSRVRLAD
ncbi:response regulator [Nocardioides sp. zg-579]|uniref:Response regulator n=1 Tax=Nocardioides marmotae TaxID=2663857 RepID=A0A6I3JFZ5_9ACTN|nr:response regulator transcription factor [Nocardioides marmotae]MCR6033392.1 response regulator [Gordonia jinghuaiqii]MTB97049.1 response regulator [Nocardioides marmotae]QKE00711.1 response regulator [Nocardioides marmotae]